MPRKYLTFIALAISILYGAGFAALDPTPNGYAAVGGALVAIGWIAVGVFGKDDPEPRGDSTTEVRAPFGTPPEDRP